jgi:hypothetical protein
MISGAAAFHGVLRLSACLVVMKIAALTTLHIVPKNRTETVLYAASIAAVCKAKVGYM